ncbi:MAG: sulfotransferase [Blastocatellia bacterium]
MEYMRPKFFIIGVNKCGTSSLYRYLIAHPNVLPCAEKEPNFFGQHNTEYIASHIDEYFALFPTNEYSGDLSFDWESADQAGTSPVTRVHVSRYPERDYITGEASANTFHDVCPSLLYSYLPDVKLILLVRNPADRAYSHHRMYGRFRAGGNGFDVEVSDFETDIQAELEAHARGEKTHYIAPGIYIDKLREWVSQYGHEQIRVVVSEELAQPAKAKLIMRDLEGYLELPHNDYGNFLTHQFNHAPMSELAPRLRSLLTDFYRTYNCSLQEYLGRELYWD